MGGFGVEEDDDEEEDDRRSETTRLSGTKSMDADSQLFVCVRLVFTEYLYWWRFGGG